LNFSDILVSVDNNLYQPESIVKAIDMVSKITTYKFKLKVSIFSGTDMVVANINLKNDPKLPLVTAFATLIAEG
jgi:hypothetical protein